MTSIRRPLATAAMAGAATLLLAAPGAAHPSFDPNTITPAERHTLDLVVPHGCVAGGTGAPEGDQEASPTTAVSVQVPESGVAFIAPHEVEGWSLTTSANSFTWTDEGGSSTEPLTFVVDVELQAEVTDAVYFAVAQDCAEGSMLWVASPTTEGDNPAAVLQVGEAVGNTEVDHGEGGHGDLEGGDIDHDAAAATGDHEGAPAAPLDAGLVVLVLVLVVGGIAGILKME